MLGCHLLFSRSALAIALLAPIEVMLTGCADAESSRPQEAARQSEPATVAARAAELVGKWTEIKGDGKVIEFTADGRVMTSGHKGDFVGTFSLPDPDHIKLELSRESNHFDEKAHAVVEVFEFAGPPIIGSYAISSGRLVITIGDEVSTYERKVETPVAVNAGTPSSVAAPDTATVESLCAVGTADEPGSRNIILGANAFRAKTAAGQSIGSINAFLALWLGCAQTDIDKGDFDSAQVRLEKILLVLRERQGDDLLIGSTQTRLALVALKSSQWSQALTYAKSAADAFEPLLAQGSRAGKPRIWLNWGGYDEVTTEPLLALLVLTRAQRANQDPQWAATIAKAINTAERTAGLDSELYRSCVRLRAELSQ